MSSEESQTERDPKWPRLWFYLAVLTVTMLSLQIPGGNSISDGMFALSFMTLILGPSVRRPARTPALVTAGGLVAVGAALSMTRAQLPTENVMNSLRLVCVMTLLPWLAQSVLRERAHVVVAMRCFALGATADALFAFAQTQNPALSPVVQENGRIVGFALHPTDAGGMLTVALPVVFALSFGDRGLARKLGWVLAGAAILVGLILSGSVSGFIATAIGALVLGFRLRVRTRVFATAAVLIPGVVAFTARHQVAGLNLSPLERINSTTSGRYDTFASRLQTDQIAIDRIKDNPVIGAGLDHLSGITTLDLQAHNLLLLVWLQGGILCLLGLILGLSVSLRLAFTRLERGDFVHAGLAASLVSAIAFAMTSPLLAQRYLWLPMALIIAFMTTRSGNYLSAADQSSATPPQGQADAVTFTGATQLRR